MLDRLIKKDFYHQNFVYEPNDFIDCNRFGSAGSLRLLKCIQNKG